MKIKYVLMLSVVLLLTISTLGAGRTFAKDRSNDGEGHCIATKGKKVTIATAKLIIEYNATDNDIGVHGAFDDQGWSKLCVFDPNGRQVLAVKPRAQLRKLSMGGIFFESREPPADE